MCKTLYFFFLFIFSLIANAQSSKFDSLLSKYLQLSDQDTSKVLVLIHAANDLIYIEYNYDSAIELSEMALKLSVQNDNENGQSYAYNYLGRAYRGKRLYNSALQNFLKGLVIAKKLGNTREVAVTHLEIANIYASLNFSFGDNSADQMFNEALFHSKQFYELSQKVGDKDMNGAACDALGGLFLSHKDYDSAEFYFRKGTEIGRERGLEISGEIHLVEVLVRKGDFKNAKRKNLDIIKKLQHINPGTELITEESIVVEVYQRMIEIYEESKSFDSAQYYLDKTKKIAVNLKDQITRLSLDLIQAELFIATKQYDKAIKLCQDLISYASAKEHSFPTIILPSYNLLAEAYKGEHHYEKAYEYLVKFFVLKDSIFNSNTSSEVLRQQTDFEMASKNNEVELLIKERSISELSISRQNIVIVSTIVALLLSFVIALSITNRYKIVQRSKKEQEQLFKELDTLKSRFFANISHEFRTPLTLLLGPLEKRLSVATETADRNELTVMHRNASRLLTLVNQLLDLSRLEAGTLTLKGHYQPLHEFIHSIASQFSSMADSKTINFRVLADQPVSLFFDSDKLEKIITNLLSNAFKFTPAGGSITLTLKEHEPNERFKNGYAEIIVADSGPGMEAEHLEKIFDRFYQADTSSTRGYEGSGIGLALTKELVELHHGSITVTSTPGKGSSFTVQLPQGTAHLNASDIEYTKKAVRSNVFLSNGSAEAIEHETAVGEGPLPRVLVVEDNADLRSYLHNSLKDIYQIYEASDGEQGLIAALEEIPDLIISDLMMPKMDGLQLCEKLKNSEKTSHIPLILLTAKADIETKIEGLHTGADDYMAKPFDARELKARIYNLIESRRNLQQKFSRQFSLSVSEIQVESLEDRFLKKVKGTIEVQIGDSTLSVETLAEEVAMSAVQLYRKLKALTGQTPNELIRNMRMDRAASLLRQHAGNVSEVAYQVGFNNLSYFAKCFKEKFDVTPSEFTNSFKI